MQGHLHIVGLLIKRGIDVNVPSFLAWTALMSAFQQTEMTRLLIEHGANVNAVDNQGMAA